MNETVSIFFLTFLFHKTGIRKMYIFLLPILTLKVFYVKDHTYGSSLFSLIAPKDFDWKQIYECSFSSLYVIVLRS
jgi:hypothetical protein